MGSELGHSWYSHQHRSASVVRRRRFAPRSTMKQTSQSCGGLTSCPGSRPELANCASFRSHDAVHSPWEMNNGNSFPDWRVSSVGLSKRQITWSHVKRMNTKHRVFVTTALHGDEWCSFTFQSLCPRYPLVRTVGEPQARYKRDGVPLQGIHCPVIHPAVTSVTKTSELRISSDP